MAMQGKTWMATLLFKEFLFLILGGVSFNNRHLSIPNGCATMLP
jgi:hypothetical protein